MKRWLELCGVLALVAVAVVVFRYHYQTVADRVPWTWSDEKASLDYCLRANLTNYVVDSDSRVNEREMTIRLKRDGKEVLEFQAHSETVLTRFNHILFISRHHPIATGCAVLAFDLKTGKQLWEARLDGIGPISHSKYRNRVNIETDGRAVTVWGNESAGRYVEILDAKTGKMLGHKAFGGR